MSWLKHRQLRTRINCRQKLRKSTTVELRHDDKLVTTRCSFWNQQIKQHVYVHFGANKSLGVCKKHVQCRGAEDTAAKLLTRENSNGG